MKKLKNYLETFIEKIFGKTQIYTETPIHGEPWNGILDLDHYIKCTTVKGASNKFKKVSSFLVSTFLKNRDLDKIRVDNFTPISKTIEKQPIDMQKTMIEKIVNNLQEHFDPESGALIGCHGVVEGIGERPEVMERRLPSFATLTYLNVLANTLKFLGDNKSGILTQEGRDLSHFYSKTIGEILDFDTTVLNDKIQKVELKKSLFRRPSEDTNIEDLKSI